MPLPHSAVVAHPANAWRQEEEEEARRMAWRARKEAELAAARPMQSSTEEGRQRAEAEATAERRPEEPRDGRGLAR